MKRSIHLAGLLFCFPFCASAQNTAINENPVAYRYLLKHFELRGKVKSVTTYGSNNYLMTDELFDPEGRITTMISYSGMSSKASYTYDKAGNFIRIAHQSGNQPAVNYLYQYNNNREVEFSLYKEGDPLRKFEYKNTLLVKDSGANRYSTQKVYYSYYEYNGKGQLAKLRNYNGGDKLSREEVYTYESNVVTIKGSTYPGFYGGSISSYEKKKYYDANGNLVKSTFTQDGKTETTEYKLDGEGNWIWKTGGMTRKIQYYETAPAASTKTGKRDNTDQLSLILDENFENNQNKWPVWDNQESAAQITNGNYRVHIKEYKYSRVWLAVPVLAADQSKDFTIETKVFLSSADTGNTAGGYWLLWGVGNNGNDFYAFGIYPDGKCKYGKQLNNQWEVKTGPIASASVQAGINKANVIRVEKKAGNIFFFVNAVEVAKAPYEQFSTNYSGIGFEFNNKKIVDVEYLRVFQGTASTIALSPEPYESDYQKKLRNAGNSKERADAIIDYYLGVKQLNYASERIESLLGQKFLQMMDIDYHGFYEVLMSKRINFEDIKLCMKASEVLTKEQKGAVKLISQYTIDEFLATQNNTAKPAYPAGIPQPGYGWGKTVSSDKTVSVVNSPVGSRTEPAKPVVTEAQLKEVTGKFFDGKTKVYNSGFVMKIISYHKKSYGDGYEVEIKIARKPPFNQGACNLERKTVDAETLFYPTDTYYTLHDPYETCKSCNGTGVVTQTTSHTNDYQYTLGTKTTYTSTSKVKCIACAPGSYRPMKALAACIENNNY